MYRRRERWFRPGLRGMIALNDSCKGPIPNDPGDFGSGERRGGALRPGVHYRGIITLEELQQLLESGGT